MTDWLEVLLSDGYKPVVVSGKKTKEGFYFNQKESLEDCGINQIEINEFINVLKSSKRLELFKTHMSNINKKYMYRSELHGISHNERVALFSFYLSEMLDLNNEDFNIIMYAALYHDIGRTNDFVDDLHGLKSAKKIKKLKLDLSEDDQRVLKTIITAHSMDDQYFDKVFDSFGAFDYARCKKLYSILKDCDGLDRVRLFFPMVSAEMLRNPESKSLILTSYNLLENCEQIKKSLSEEQEKE